MLDMTRYIDKDRRLWPWIILLHVFLIISDLSSTYRKRSELFSCIFEDGSDRQDLRTFRTQLVTHTRPHREKRGILCSLVSFILMISLRQDMHTWNKLEKVLVRKRKRKKKSKTTVFASLSILIFFVWTFDYIKSIFSTLMSTISPWPLVSTGTLELVMNRVFPSATMRTRNA